LWLKLPVLFDIFTAVLLLGGCLLLWLNLRAPNEDLVPTIKERGDPQAEESVDPTAELFETKEGSELRADKGAVLLNAAPARDPDAHAEAVFSTDQNHYASSVSAAIARSRKPPAGV
jgi:hypothetical protein